MLRFSKLKVFTIIAAVLIGMYLAVPSLMTQEQRQAFQNSIPGWVPSWLVPTHAISLGLDLQGGSHVLLEVDAQDLLRTQVALMRDDVRRILREARVAPQGGIQLTPRGVQVRVPDPADRERLLPRLRELAQPTGNAVLGQTGGTDIEISTTPEGVIALTYTEAGFNERIRRAVDQSIEVVRRRVDVTGTTEPNIQRQGADRILVQVPGLQDPQRLKELLGRTAKLEFRLLAQQSTGDVDMLPMREEGGQRVPVERRVIAEGADLTDAQPAFDSRTNEPIVNFRFNIRGAQRFGQATSENVGRPLAIVLDNEVISAPTIQSPITGGQGQISGRFTVQQVNDLAVLLRAGALPAKLTIIEERTVGPGLGQDSIEAGRTAVIIGSVLVAAFMIASYGLLGIIAVAAVAINVALILGVMSVMGATLTLPGIAGILLTIGMAVDSNVLIYERIREEARLGRSAVSSLDQGFGRALGTILDANFTTLLAAGILFFLGTGPVRGFAVTLSIGVITTVFTAYTVTRLMIAGWYHFTRPKAINF
ncbi:MULTISPECIES: protein translocase subunit SecD [Microvirga]|uniref:protein translocase subunit SecD n=1 Tax=Microvirga TaxID=186650 RepID=UPI001CFFCBF8|nr:protein translocase subunit SecD [Microvirga lenta]MCB5176996.1 protein translocase subunit SecD [Microvirga lenta]